MNQFGKCMISKKYIKYKTKNLNDPDIQNTKNKIIKIHPPEMKSKHPEKTANKKHF